MKLDVTVAPMVERIAAHLIREGAIAVYLVGGAIIDLIKGEVPKDWDLEVFGVTPEGVELMLGPYRPQAVGKAFGIHKLDSREVAGLDIDVSVPRRDNQIGLGHKELVASFDPLMSVEDACRRRDFTINAMALDLATMELADPFEGLEDLERGRLKATDPALFVQDPLRALRAMQLAARKAPYVEDGTLSLIRSMATQEMFDSLPRERLMEEFTKLLYKAPAPSVGLEILRESRWLRFFPELGALIGVEQERDWHPEGDCWVHTLQVVDAMAQLRALASEGTYPKGCPQDVTEGEWRTLMWGALCHDLGKPSTVGVNDKGQIVNHKHATEGEKPTRALLARLTNNGFTEDVVTLVTCHHRLGDMTRPDQPPGEKAWRKLWRDYRGFRMAVAALLSRADWTGSEIWGVRHVLDPEDSHPVAKVIWAKAPTIVDVHVKTGPPRIINGDDLIVAGMKPGPLFKIALEAAALKQQQGETNKAVLLRAALEVDHV